ncbi:MAG: hypothetical protein IJ289_03140 [Clostridia bacterium]|nr:hypothetical protein [Clostridia bacterium]
MNIEQLINSIGNVEDEYIDDAVPSRKNIKSFRYGWIAAVLAVVFVLMFSQTPLGVAAFSTIKENVIEFVESLFPPKDVVVYIEGETEIMTHMPAVQEASTQENDELSSPGFVIYYDSEMYTMVEENNVTYIRYISGDNLPVCEMEIKFIPDVKPEMLADAVRNEMCSEWAYVSEIYDLYGTDAVCFDFSAGDEWNSVCGKVSIFSAGENGAFLITARYFGEAQEGHGVRFAQMLQTFEVIE